MKRFLLAALLVEFALLTVYALFTQGFSGAIDLYTIGNAWTYQLTVDFLIALGIATGWMIGDARKRGVSWKPYLVLTLLLGSIGPLTYVVVHKARDFKSSRQAARAGAPGLAARSHASA